MGYYTICSICKKETEIKINEGIYRCDCGFECDRDLNAAINILREGASSLGLDRVIPKYNLVSIV